MQIVKQGGRLDYNYKEIYCDSQADMNNIDMNNICPGSVVYIISDGNIFILNSNKQWIKQ